MSVDAEFAYTICFIKMKISTFCSHSAIILVIDSALLNSLIFSINRKFSFISLSNSFQRFLSKNSFASTRKKCNKRKVNLQILFKRMNAITGDITENTTATSDTNSGSLQASERVCVTSKPYFMGEWQCTKVPLALCNQREEIPTTMMGKCIVYGSEWNGMVWHGVYVCI